MKRIIAILMVLVLVMSFVGCKKKTEEPKEEKKPAATATEAPTPTPEPVTTEDLRKAFSEEIGKRVYINGAELSSDVDEQIKTLTNFLTTSANSSGEAPKFSLNFPDGTVKLDGQFDFFMDLFGFMNTKMSFDFDAVMKTSKGISEADLKVTADNKTESAFSEEPEEDHSEDSVKFYIDSTSDKEIVTWYKGANDDHWVTQTKPYSELISQAAESASSATDDIDKDKEYFKDFDKFIDKHTDVAETSNGYKMTIEFNWSELYNEYKNDFDSMTKAVQDTVGDLLGGSSDAFADAFNKFFSDSTGNYKTVVEYDKDKSVKRIVLDMKDIKFSAEIKADDGESATFAIGCDKIYFDLKLDRTPVSVEIPAEVKETAVAYRETQVDPYDEDYDWNWDYDDWETIDTDYSDYDTSDLGDVVVTDSGINISVGDRAYCELHFPVEWKVDTYSYTVGVTVDENDDIGCTYDCSYVKIGSEDDIFSYAESLRDIYGEDSELEVTTVENSKGGTDYIITYYGTEKTAEKVDMFMHGSIGSYYLRARAYCYADWDTGEFAASFEDLINAFKVEY